jgi:hypothetical protein
MSPSRDQPDDRVLVAIRTDQSEFHVAGTRHGYRCSECSCELSVAPAGQKFLKENPHVPILCVDCAIAAKPDRTEAAPGAIDELIADRLRRARRHQHN